MTRLERVTAFATRAGLTEGQLYSVAVGIVVLALLAASLPRLHGVIDNTTTNGQRPVTSATSPTSPATGRETQGAPSSAGVSSLLPPGVALPPVGTTPLTGPGPDGDGGGAEGEPPLLPCPAEATFEGAADVLFTLDMLALGTIPSRSTARALAIALGCSGEDVGIVAIALLMEIGDGLPDTGFDNDTVPVLPTVDLPPEIIDLVQPARPAIDPVCENVATVSALIILAASHYPAPIDTVLAQTVFGALNVCGQVQKLGTPN